MTKQKTRVLGEIPSEYMRKVPDGPKKRAYKPAPLEAVKYVCFGKEDEAEDWIREIAERYGVTEHDAKVFIMLASKMALETPVCFIAEAEMIRADYIYVVEMPQYNAVWIIAQRPWDYWVDARLTTLDSYLEELMAYEDFWASRVGVVKTVKLTVENWRVVDRTIYVTVK